MSKQVLTSKLIAPCGMNCGLCMAYIRDKKPCEGCHGSDTNKPHHCAVCSIKKCEALKGKFCYTCVKYPCRRLKQLDKRYRAKYGMSMIENLNKIKDIGVRDFTKQEKTRWLCDNCGHVICVHKDACLHCGAEWKAIKNGI